MLQPKKKSIYQTLQIPSYVIYFLNSLSNLLIFSENLSFMDDKDYLVLDHATICTDWYHLWSSFGFNEYQWTSRAAKVEEYTRVIVIYNYKYF